MFTSFFKKYFIWLCWILVVAYEISCSAACGISVPQPEIQPTSPALQGGFLITGSPGKSPHVHVHTLTPDQLDDSVSAKGDHSDSDDSGAPECPSMY